MRRNHVAGLLLAAGLMPGFLLAHEGHKVMGTVTAVDAKQVEVKDKDGKTVSIALTTATKFMRPAASAGAKSQAVSLADVKVGQRVVVAVSEEGEKMTANEYVPAATEKPQPHSEPHQH